MSVPRPAVELVVDGRALSGPEAAALAVVAELRTGASVDRVRLAVGPLSPLLDAAPGATLEVSLGYGDDLTAAFSGVVTAVWHSPAATTIEALARATALSRARVGRSYVRQQVADIVTDLLGAAGVDPGEVDAPVEMAVFHADERRTVWQHLQALARLTGRETASRADGAVNFVPPRRGAADHALRAGAELTGWSVAVGEQGEAVAPAAPISAAGEKGADAWHLLHHEPGGTGAALLHPAIRQAEAARAWGEGLSAAAARLRGGGVLVAVGDPAIRAGDLVEVEDVPRAGGAYRIREAEHVLDASGLRTRLRLEAVA